jgi:hypothetical protein
MASNNVAPFQRDENETRFLCPLFQSHPFDNPNCVSFCLKRIADLKQHIQRKHLAAHHCEVCDGRWSKTSKAFSRHNQLKTQGYDCRRLKRDHGLLTKDEMKALSARTPHLSPEEQYMHICQTLSPGRVLQSVYSKGDILRDAFVVFRQQFEHKMKALSHTIDKQTVYDILDDLETSQNDVPQLSTDSSEGLLSNSVEAIEFLTEPNTQVPYGVPQTGWSNGNLVETPYLPPHHSTTDVFANNTLLSLTWPSPTIPNNMQLDFRGSRYIPAEANLPQDFDGDSEPLFADSFIAMNNATAFEFGGNETG